MLCTTHTIYSVAMSPAHRRFAVVGRVRAGAPCTVSATEIGMDIAVVDKAPESTPNTKFKSGLGCPTRLFIMLIFS